MANLYIIAGCNGSGKTTASKSFLPERLNCKEFINADEIARGLSPFQPDTVAITAGKIMLSRIKEMISNNKDFAVETTMTSYQTKALIENCLRKKYKITIVFIYLESVNLAIERVKDRVSNGGHNVSEEIINRRYYKGLTNFFNYYKNIVDYWLLIDNSFTNPTIVAEGSQKELNIIKQNEFEYIQRISNERND